MKNANDKFKNLNVYYKKYKNNIIYGIVKKWYVPINYDKNI